MRKFFLFIQVIVLSSVCLFSSGCWFLIIGGAGAVGGYAISRDTFEGASSKGQSELMAASHKVLAIMGTISDERVKEGEIIAIVNGAHVTVNVFQVNLTTSKLRVRARNGIFPRIGLAQDIYTKVMNQLE